MVCFYLRNLCNSILENAVQHKLLVFDGTLAPFGDLSISGDLRHSPCVTGGFCNSDLCAGQAGLLWDSVGCGGARGF